MSGNRGIDSQRRKSSRGPAGTAAFLIACLSLLVAARPAQVVDRPAALPYLLGPERNASRWPGTQAEISIAVDRFQPNRAIIASMSIDDGRMLVMTTSDAGRTWAAAPVPLGPGATLDADPWVTFDSRGVAYLAKIPVIHGNYDLGIDVCRSADGGQTWSAPLRISSDLNQDDKLAIAADDNPGSPFRDNVYVVWKRQASGPYISRSTDGGQTFSPPQELEKSLVTGHSLAVAADGTVYLAFRDYLVHSIRVMRSTDGGSTFSPSVRIADVRAGYWVSPPSACIRRALVHASVAVDRSPGPYWGRVYVSWADYPPGITDASCPYACSSESRCSPNVYESHSSDGGWTWTSPVVVHEPGFGAVDRFHQWIGTDPETGEVFIAYKDTQNDPSRETADVYMTRSTDGGETWQPAIRLSSAAGPAGSFFQFGDYQSLGAAGGRVYVAWADYRDDSNNAEVYTRVLDFDPRRIARPALPIERQPLPWPIPKPVVTH